MYEGAVRHKSYSLLMASVMVLLLMAGALAPTDSLFAWPVAQPLTVDTSTMPGATLYRSAETGLVRSLIGNLSFYGVEGTPEDIARLFLSEYADLLTVPPSTADLVLEAVGEGQALRHVRFRQEYFGIPVWMGGVTVHMTKDQVIVKVDNRYLPGIALTSLTPGVNEAAAGWIAVRAVAPAADLFSSGAGVMEPAELYIRGSDLERPHLVWVMMVCTADNLSGWRVTVDATSGSVIEIYDTRIAYTGSGLVFDPNPVVTYSGNPAKPPNPDNERKTRTLYDMDSSYYLRGSWANAYNYSGARAQEASRTYNYSYTNNWFEEVMAYYHCTTAQRYLQAIPTRDMNRRQQPVIVNDSSYGRDARYLQSWPYEIHVGRASGYVDLGEDGDVFLHEYNHSMLDDLHERNYYFWYGIAYPNPCPCPDIQSAAVAEAYADWFACNFSAHVDPAFSNGTNDRVADWAFWAYLRKVNNPGRNYDTPGVSPDTIVDAYFASGMWSDLLWNVSHRLGQKATDKLLGEWADTIDDSPTWAEAANSLLVADNALNAGLNKHVLMTQIKGHNIPSITDENKVFARVEVEHGDLSKLKVTLGVRNASGGVLVSTVLTNYGLPSGPGTKVWLQDCGGWQSYFPPTSSYIWFVTVQEKPDDTVIHDQGVIRDFYVFRGASSYPSGDALAWVPIFENQTTEAVIPEATLTHYAQIELGHSDFSPLEMVLGVKDLTDETDMPGWQLRVTKNGLAGWATPAHTADEQDLHIKINLNNLASRMPPSLARRWYLGIRDSVDDDHTGTLNNFRIMSSSVWYNAQTGSVPVAISEAAPQSIQMNASPTTKSSAYGRQAISGSITVKVGCPGWESGPLSSPYTNVDITSGQTWLPPRLGNNRWWWSVTAGAYSGTINWFALYDKATPRVYRSAGPPVTVNAGGTAKAYIAYRDTATFPDVPTTHEAWMEIEGLVKAQIVFGYPDGTFRPSENITRAQMAVFIARAVAGGDANVPPGPPTPSFTDVPTDYWAYKYIEYCKALGIVQGYPDGTYRPEKLVTRDQIAVYVSRAISGYDIMSPPASPTYTDVQPDFWAYKHIEYLRSGMNTSGGVVCTDYGSYYHPEYNVTRGMMSIFMARGFAVPQ